MLQYENMLLYISENYIKNIVGFTALLDHGYLARRKVLELLLLGCRLRRDHLKAGCHQHVLSILRASRCAGATNCQR